MGKMEVSIFALSFLSCAAYGFQIPMMHPDTTTTSLQMQNSGRREFFKSGATSALLPVLGLTLTSSSLPANAETTSITTASSGLLPDLPPDAVRSYLQYRTPLQISADYYLFDLRDQIKDINQWGEINALFNSQNARGGQGQPSALER